MREGKNFNSSRVGESQFSSGRRLVDAGDSRAKRRSLSSQKKSGPTGMSGELGEMFSLAWNKKLFYKIALKFGFRDKRKKRPDYSILVIVLLLIALGTLTLYAIGPAVLKRTGGGLGRQTLFLAVGLVGLGAAYKFPKPELFAKWAPYMLLIGLILCAAILIPGVGKIVYGGRRWIELGPINMQPSELVKAAMVFFLSGMAVYFKSSTRSVNTQVAYFCVLGGVVGAFILILQRDLGTTLVISSITIFVLISAGVSRAVIAKLVGLGAVVLVMSILMFGYRRERLLSFLGRSSITETLQIESPADYHLRQSLIGIGSGGLYGRGVGKSVQSFGYLPEAPSDSIFAVYAEKFGFMGSIVLLALMGALVKRMLRVMRGLDSYWRAVVAGITGWVVGNFAVNMSSILGLIPFTGVPLPFFSLGGTSLVIMLTMMGVVLNLSSYKKNKMHSSSTLNQDKL
jgi:cell division protein FtsW